MMAPVMDSEHCFSTGGVSGLIVFLIIKFKKRMQVSIFIEKKLLNLNVFSTNTLSFLSLSKK